MPFLSYIVDQLTDIGDFFYEAYLEVLGWVYPFWYLSYPLYDLCYAFYYLAGYFSDFYYWAYDINNKVADILSWSTIWSYILSYIPNLEAIRDWFSYWMWWVDWRVTGWWSSTRYIVQGWIDIAVEGLDDLRVAWSNFWNITFPEWTGKLNTLRAEWDNFWTYTLPNLLNISMLLAWWNDKLIDIQSLIDSAFLLRSSFWEGWQDWRDKVAEFFTDPEDWLYKSLDRIIERFW